MKLILPFCLILLCNHLTADLIYTEHEVKKGMIVITGASSGIGKATAIHFSRSGYPLLLIARRLAQIEELKLPNTLCIEADVTDLASFSEAIRRGEERFGDVECLINNAGILFAEFLHQQTPSDWEKMLQVNVFGVLNGIHLVLDKMIQRQTGQQFPLSCNHLNQSYLKSMFS